MSDKRLRDIDTDDLVREIKRREQRDENIASIEESEWIDILDDYPERGKTVIVLAEGFEDCFEIYFAEWDTYCWDNPGWVDRDGNQLELPDGYNVRAWLPMPQIPKRYHLSRK